MVRDVVFYLATIAGAVLIGAIGGKDVALPLGAVVAAMGFGVLIVVNAKTPI